MTEKATINHEPVLPAEGKAELQEQAETKTHKEFPSGCF
jgi:hypothetical protein